MRVPTSLEIAGAVVATAAAAVAAVWLTGDTRAFGVVIAIAGLAVGVALGREEWRMSHRRGADSARHSHGGPHRGQAA